MNVVLGLLYIHKEGVGNRKERGRRVAIETRGK